MKLTVNQVLNLEIHVFMPQKYAHNKCRQYLKVRFSKLFKVFGPLISAKNQWDLHIQIS